MRRKKDTEALHTENKKIEILEEDIQEKHNQYQIYFDKSKKIEEKVRYMKKFDEFLEKVKDEHQDEFDEIQAIVSRYKQLEDKNKQLHLDQANFTKALDQKTKDLTQYQKEMETEKITINNRISTQQ